MSAARVTCWSSIVFNGEEIVWEAEKCIINANIINTNINTIQSDTPSSRVGSIASSTVYILHNVNNDTGTTVNGKEWGRFASKSGKKNEINLETGVSGAKAKSFCGSKEFWDNM